MRQVASVYHRPIGDILVTAVSDGHLDTSFEILQGITPEEGERMMDEARLPSPPRIAVNAFLVRHKGRTALIETGSGDSMGPSLGHLMDNIRAAGVAPEAIDTVLLTHMHPDHSNGLTGPGGERNFPGAEILLHEKELRHWTDDAEMARAPERKKERYFRAARRHIAAYERQLRPFESGEVFPGVTAMSIAGHTPGHTAYVIAAGDESLMIWGDIVHVPNIQIQRPEVTLDFDSDAGAAAAMRRRVFDMAASDRMLVGGMHLDFPGFGYVGRQGDGYRYFPEPWKPLL